MLLAEVLAGPVLREAAMRLAAEPPSVIRAVALLDRDCGPNETGLRTYAGCQLCGCGAAGSRLR